MKKKMLFMAAIAGLFVLGSCVKDDVSGSVEAVRQAKANELNGLANQANANAALANAQAAHRAASSAADIALTQAQTAVQNATAALNKANAEAAQLNTDIQRETYAQNLEVARVNADAALEAAKTALAGNLAANDFNEYNRINTLVTKFTTAYNDFIDAQQDLIDKKVALETAKISAEHAQTVIDKDVVNAENTLEKEQAVLNYIKEQGQKGTSKTEIDTRKAVIAEEQGQLKLNYQNSSELPAFVKVSQDFPATYQAYLKAEDALLGVNDDVKAVTGSDLYTQKAGDAGKGGVKNSTWSNLYKGGEAGYVAYEVLGASNSKTTSFKYKDRNKVETTYTVVADGEFKVYENKADAKKLNDAADAYEKKAVAAYNTALDELGTPEDKATTKVADNSKLTLYAELAKAKDAQDDADYEVYKVQRDYDNAGEDLAKAKTDADKIAAYNKQDAAMDKLYGGFNEAKMPVSEDTALKQAKYRASSASITNRKKGTDAGDDDLVKQAEDKAKDVKTAQDNIDTWLKTNKATVDKAAATLAADQAKVKAVKADIEKAAEPLAAYTKACDDLAAYEAKFNAAATALKDVVEKPQKALNDELTALNAIYAEDYNVALANQEEKVAKAEEDLAKAKNVAAAKNPELIISNAEQAVQKAENVVAEKTALLAAAKKALEDADIEFDLDDEDEPAEETPAEETPAENTEG